MKGSCYVAKQGDSGAASSADEEEYNVDSDAGDLDEDGENKSVNSAQSIKSKTSTVKKKREVVSFVYLCVLLM